jgi:hypothetical protein
VFLDAVGTVTFIVLSGPTNYHKKMQPDARVIIEFDRRGTVFRTHTACSRCSRPSRCELANAASLSIDGGGENRHRHELNNWFSPDRRRHAVRIVILGMTMLRLTAGRRSVLAEAFRELANLAAAALILGQLIGQQPLSPGLVLAGAAMWAVFLGIALLFAGGNNND